jgi:hypothetical protein
MEIRTQHVINKSLFWLIIDSSSLILENNIVVPSTITNMLVTQSRAKETCLGLPSFHAKVTFLGANIQ